jgi:hypothetical protein
MLVRHLGSGSSSPVESWDDDSSASSFTTPS